jgi:hypothetical protein
LEDGDQPRRIAAVARLDVPCAYLSPTIHSDSSLETRNIERAEFYRFDNLNPSGPGQQPPDDFLQPIEPKHQVD